MCFSQKRTYYPCKVGHSQKETYIPAIHFQVLGLFRGVYLKWKNFKIFKKDDGDVQNRLDTIIMSGETHPMVISPLSQS